MSDKEAPQSGHRPLREAGYEERGIGADILSGVVGGLATGIATPLVQTGLNHLGRTAGSTQDPAPPPPSASSGSGGQDGGQ